MKRIAGIVLGVLWGAGVLYAQEPAWNYGLQGHYGMIIPHSKILKEVSHSNPFGMNVSAGRLHTSESAWGICNCFYRTGWILNYYNFANPEELGHSANLRLFFEPLVAPQNRFYGSIRMGVGLAWVTRVYDEERNPANYFFSIPLGFPLFASGFMHYKLKDGWEVKAGANFNHISNGGIKEPNKGMNFPTISLGLQYNPVTDYPLHEPAANEQMEGDVELAFRLSGMIKAKQGSEHYEQKHCLVAGGLLSASYYFSNRWAVTSGMEFIYDGYQKESIKRLGLDNQPHRIGVLAGPALQMRNVGFSPKIGFYALLPDNLSKRFYQRYDLTYRITDYLAAGVYMHALLNVAEFMGIGLTVNW